MERNIARLLTKIAGLLLLIYGVLLVPGVLAAFLEHRRDAQNLVPFIAAAVIALIWISLGLGLLCGTRRIVDRTMFSEPQTGVAPDLRAIEEVAIAVLGLYLFATGITASVGEGVQLDFFYRLATANRQPISIPQNEYAGIAAAATRIILGLALFFLSRGVVALRRRLLSLRPMARDRDEASSAG